MFLALINIVFAQAEGLDLQREHDRVKLCTLGSELSHEELGLLMKQKETTPEQRHILICGAHQLKEPEQIYKLLNATGADADVGSRTLALQLLDLRNEWIRIKPLITVFLRSRFSSLPEDPDLFEHAARLLNKVPHKHFEDQLPHFSAQLLLSKVDQIHNNWGLSEKESQNLTDWTKTESFKRTQSQLLIDLQSSFSNAPARWQNSLLSEEGTLIFELSELAEEHMYQSWSAFPGLKQRAKDLSRFKHIPIPSMLKPGQSNVSPPSPSRPKYKKNTSSSTFPVVPAVICVFLLLFIKRYNRLAGLTFAALIVLILEAILSQFISSKAESAPLFSFNSWQYQPFEERIIDNKEWLVSQGGPVRWQQFLKIKPKQGKRVFVLGASSAHGSNHLIKESFSMLLEDQWRKDHPNKHRQIINFGIGGTISNGVLHAGSWALDNGADGLIVYYGHNEATQFTQLSEFNINLRLLQLRMKLSHSFIFSGLSALFDPISKPLHQPMLKATKQNDTPEKIQQSRDLAAENYVWNMGRLLQKAQQKNIPVLLIKATPNFRFAPSEPWDSEGQSLKEEAEELARSGAHAQARLRYQQSIEKGSEISTITLKIQRATVDLAKRYEADYLDAEEIFYGGSPDGLSANTYFWDELHPSKEGHKHLSETIYPWLKEEIQ